MSANKDIRRGIELNKDGEPVFIISDLLPHLAQKQLEKKANEFIEGEMLNILVGSKPIDDKQGIKKNIVKILNEMYGISERDLFLAELQVVPAIKPREGGLDKSLIFGYGHDDRACTFSALKAFIDSDPKETVIIMFVDREEIGSEGNTSVQSYNFIYFINKISELCKWNKSNEEILINAKAISGDVTSAFDPNFKDVFDLTNVNKLGFGVSIEKYEGSYGKYYSNEAPLELVSEIINLFDKHKVIWQTGEIGKVDIGGGGTVSIFLARFGMKVVDIGPPVLGMHSPYEVLSKIDLYFTYKGYKVFLNGR